MANINFLENEVIEFKKTTGELKEGIISIVSILNKHQGGKLYFGIKDNGEIVKAEMKNKPITGTVEITKQDVSTNEPLPNTLIEVYNEKDELVFSGRTDENGKITIENLRYGKYYFLEKEAPEGYSINPEKMYFEILEDGKIVKCTMVDEKVVIEVPSTGIEDYHIVELMGSLLILSGIGVIVYVKKKRN